MLRTAFSHFPKEWLDLFRPNSQQHIHESWFQSKFAKMVGRDEVALLTEFHCSDSADPQQEEEIAGKEIIMAKSRQQTERKPASKHANLQEKMQRQKAGTKKKQAGKKN